MGIKKIGDRVRIFVAIKQLRNKTVTNRKQKNMVRLTCQQSRVSADFLWYRFNWLHLKLQPSTLANKLQAARIPSWAHRHGLYRLCGLSDTDLVQWSLREESSRVISVIHHPTAPTPLGLLEPPMSKFLVPRVTRISSETLA